MFKVKSTWTGGPGLPGYTNLYFSSAGALKQEAAQECSTAVKTFFESVKGILPTEIRIAVDNLVEEIDSATGNLVAEWTTTGGGTVTPTANPSFDGYAQAAGACVTWLTAGIVAGKRVRGRTFLVPLTHAVFANDGTLQDSNRSTILTAAGTLLTPPALGLYLLQVWHRPKGGNPGSEHRVTAAKCTDKVAVLTSRRQ